MGDYRSLKVWRKAHGLVLEAYRVTAGYPSEELYGLTVQTPRSASSIPTNLAEGCGRNADQEPRYFCRVALGSASELEYQLLLGRDLGYLPGSEFDRLSGEADQIKRMLAGLAKQVRAR